MIDLNQESEEILTGTVESTQSVDASVNQSLQQDFTYTVAMIYIVSLIAGLFIFYILSRRWHA